MCDTDSRKPKARLTFMFNTLCNQQRGKHYTMQKEDQEQRALFGKVKHHPRKVKFKLTTYYNACGLQVFKIFRAGFIPSSRKYLETARYKYVTNCQFLFFSC